MKIQHVTSFQKPVLDLSITLTNKAIEQLEERKATIRSFSGTPGIIVQMDRDLLEIPDHVETSSDIEEFVESLLNDKSLTIKFEAELEKNKGAIGGIFRWYPSKNNLLLVAVYGVDANRLKYRRTQPIPFPIKTRAADNDDRINRINLGKLLFAVVDDLRESQKEKMDTDYKRFLDRSFRPFSEFLYNERLSIRDPRYRPQCRFVKRPTSDDDYRGFLEVQEPPRQLTEGGNQISAKDDNGNTYLSVRVADYDDSEQLIIIEEGNRLRDWPEEGIIFLEGDQASNRRKTQAVNLLRTRSDPVYARLADSVIRPWGLPLVDRESRSYFHPNISHDNPISVAQANAVDLALSCNDISLIHGPPGTGKTTVIVEIIRHVVAEGGRVLMVAPTHVAVDNVLERVADEHGVSAVRVGGRQYMGEHLKKYRLRDRVTALKEALPSFTKAKGKDKEIKTLQKQFIKRMENENKRFFENLVLEQSNLVCGTTIGIARYYENSKKDQINFDMLIIDEASKATVMEFLVPAVRAKKWVLVGDHRQLPPYVNDQELRIYIQRFFEDKGEDKKKVGRKDFHDQTDELIGSLRRYHEELHALSEGQPQIHWQRVVELMEYNRKPIKSMQDMISLALGSCFHYFLTRIDETRNVHLNVQHRMPSVLANFLDETIYQGNLKTSDQAATHGLALPAVESLGLGEITGPLTFVSTENLRPSYDTVAKRGVGYYNEAEAETIADIISSLVTLDAGALGYTEEEPMTIGVITYYANQSRVIVNKLRSLDELQTQRGWRFGVEGKPIKIRVSIVDRFQGQEQDIVLLSLTRANKHGRIGFLKNLQRINVSLSRAKQNLLVIGHHKFFRGLEQKDQQIILRELALYCEEHDLVRVVEAPNGGRRYKKKKRRRKR